MFTIELSPTEKQSYDELFAKAKHAIGGYIEAGGGGGGNFTSILTLLLWLRELCCDTQLLPSAAAAALRADSAATAADLLAAATRDLGSDAVDNLLELLKAGVNSYGRSDHVPAGCSTFCGRSNNGNQII